MTSALWTRRDRAQYELLTRTFFSRLFESDLMPSGLAQVRLIISAIAGTAVPLTILPVSMRLSGGLLLFVQYTLAMIALAFFALLIWEGIFPDRRDGRILSVLPIRNRTFVLARLSALVALFGIIAIGMAALPTIAFIPVLNPVAHFLGFMGVASVAFFSILTLQCIVLNVIGRASAQRLAILLQIVVVITIFQALTVVPPEFIFTGDAHTPPTGAARWLPSVWFVGLHAVISGRGNEASEALALTGALAALGMPLATVLLYAATYRRLLRRAIEGDATIAPRSAPALLGAAVKRLLVLAIPNAVTRAVGFFVLETIARSRRHKMVLAMYMGVALALVLSVVIPRAIHRGWQGFATPDAALLSAPLVLIFFSVVACRALIAIPIEIKANWLFRLREPAARSAVVSGVVAAMMAGAVVPIVILTLLIAWSLWGPVIALEHATFVAALGYLLAQILVLRLMKFPLACTYLPGASRMRVLWPFYIFFFTNYTYGMGRYQASAFRYGDILVQETLCIALTAVGLALLRRLRWERSLGTGALGLQFEAEDPESLIPGFQLSEGLAAEQTRGKVAVR